MASYPRPATELEAKMFESAAAMTVEQAKKVVDEFESKSSSDPSMSAADCITWGGCYGCKDGEGGWIIEWCVA